MKALFLGLLLLLSFGNESFSDTSTQAKAVKCNSTRIVLTTLQEQDFTPRSASLVVDPTGRTIYQTIFVDTKDKDIIVIETRMVNKESISCIVSAGKNAMTIDPHNLISGPFEDL